MTIGLPACSLAFSPDGRHLAVGTEPGVLRVLSSVQLGVVVAEAEQVGFAV